MIRVYPDRIAFCVNNECALYCRFCLRKRMVGDVEWTMKKRELGLALDWIRKTPEIRDVLLTGGDPLVFSDEKLAWLLGELRRIPHVEIVRLGTRLPVTLPFRVTDALCRLLAEHHPIWLNTHFNHPKELTPEASEACDRLTRAGVPLGNQSVLLRGINDDQAPELLGWCLERGYELRFIEQMPLDAQHGWDRDAMVTAEEILASGKADLVAIGRGLLWNPRWPWVAAAELDGTVEAPRQYWRSQPRAHMAIFGTTKFGQR